MRNKFILLVILIALPTIIWFRPQGERERIIETLTQIESLAQIEKSENLIECRTRAKAISTLIDDKVSYLYEYEDQRSEGELTRTQVVDALSAVCLRTQKATSAISKIRVDLKGKDRAEVRLFFVATWREQNESEDFTAGEDITLQFTKEGSNWRVVSGRNWLR